MTRPTLPIDALLPEIARVSRSHHAWVLHAPPGAGKTTRVPPALLQALDPAGRIVVLEPRRVAARAAAERMAEEAGERVGETYGLQMRFDRRISDATRVVVMTEGVLLRELVEDPFLEGTRAILFDEFHERSLQVDLALALARQAAEVRDDLLLGVMSATLDPEQIVPYLPGAKIFRSEGRAHPVEIVHVPTPTTGPLEQEVDRAVQRALAETDGDVLVFLPGVREIHACMDAATLPDTVSRLPLHARLTPADQARALRATSQRKVVYSTNVAETSVTLPGVTAVVDSGLVRQQAFDTRRALPRLVTVPCAQASADQRAGRAGRVRAGKAYRLWTVREHQARAGFEPPAIHRTDLSGAVLSLHAWGEASLDAFPWFEAPTPHALDAAERLLEALGALENGVLTPLGEDMARLPTHPRVARFLIEGHRMGVLRTTTTLAAILGEPQAFRSTPTPHASLSDVLDQHDALLGRPSRWHLSSPGATHRLKRMAKQLGDATRRVLGPASSSGSEDDVRYALAVAFPDRWASRRGTTDRFRLATGRGARLHPHSAVQKAAFVVALEVQDQDGAEALIRLASAIDIDRVPRTTAVEARYDADQDKLIGCKVERAAGLVVARHDGVPLPSAVAEAELVRVAKKRLARALPEDKRELTPLRERLLWLHRMHPELEVPDGSDDALRDLLPQLVPGCRSLAALRRVNWCKALLDSLCWRGRQALDQDVPEWLGLSNGQRVRMHYPAEGPPVLAARMQKLFGLTDVPLVAGQRPMLHLLAPNQRPQQVTLDLAGFWERTWPEVRKELRARYPKHDWPEDPVSASPPQRRRRG